jgi:quinol monooxygenase YgiN
MNLVQEMFRLNDLSRLPEAIERLSGLFERMKRQAGFLSAELLQDQASPHTLLVLHAWRDLADWQAYQATPEKVAFTASRPAGLYEPVVCGMNWRSLQSNGARTGRLLHREVVHGEDVPLRHGHGVEGSQTFVYEDELPQFTGCTLRLTRVSDATVSFSPEPDRVADETYLSLLLIPAEAATRA